MRWIALALLALSAPAHATDLVPPPLAGETWLVTSIDGKPLEPPPSGDNRARLPTFTFGWRTYGGNAGCNQLGGLYAQIYDRFYTMPGPQTQMACGGVRGAQEAAANAVFGASPTVRRTGETAVLSGGGHVLELKRLGPSSFDETPAMLEAAPIIGQVYVIHSVNGQPTEGKRIWSRQAPRLRFAEGKVTMSLDCPKGAAGVYNPGTEHVFVAMLSPACVAPGTRDAAMAEILKRDPRAVPGPNGELLLASRAGWAILWNERRDRPK